MSRMRRLVGLEGRASSSASESEEASESAVSGEETSPFGDGGSNDHNSASGLPESAVFDTDTCDDDPPAIDSDSLPIDPCAAIIEGATPSSPSKAPFTRGHRRRSTHVTRRDLEKFQKEVLGVENHASWFDEESGTSRINPYDPQLEELNRAFELADMSMNSGAGMANNGPGPGVFSGFDNSASSPNMANVPRQSMSPGLPHPSTQANGGGMGQAVNANMSMNAGHQMDLHHLYEMVLELSEVLKNNREVTKSIVSSAEEIMKHGSSEGASAAMQQVNGEITGKCCLLSPNSTANTST